MFWIHPGGDVVAALMLCHAGGGSGACQRKSPIGGAAYGTPLKIVMSGSAPDIPVSMPCSRWSVSKFCAAPGSAQKTS